MTGPVCEVTGTVPERSGTGPCARDDQEVPTMKTITTFPYAGTILPSIHGADALRRLRDAAMVAAMTVGTAAVAPTNPTAVQDGKAPRPRGPAPV